MDKGECIWDAESGIEKVSGWYDLYIFKSSKTSVGTVGHDKVVGLQKDLFQDGDFGLFEELGPSNVGKGCLYVEKSRILFGACDDGGWCRCVGWSRCG